MFVYFRYERDKPLENLFSRKVGLHLTETEKVAWERGGLMHGVFSRAWTGTCMSCKTRRKDDRKVPVLPADWIFPLRRCEIEDVSAWCPHETERVLTYMYGESFLTPPASTRRTARAGGGATARRTAALMEKRTLLVRLQGIVEEESALRAGGATTRRSTARSVFRTPARPSSARSVATTASFATVGSRAGAPPPRPRGVPRLRL